jgi:hypothetical protein
MAEIFIELQNPTVEIPVKSDKDPQGKRAEILVGFKRYEVSEGRGRYEELLDLVSDKEMSEEEKFDKTCDAILQEVEFLAKVKLTILEEDKRKEITLDTRKLPEGLFESETEARETLVRKFLNSTPWRQPFINALFEAFLNVSFSERAEIKN